MPLDDRTLPFEEEEKGRVLDPTPERRRLLTELFYKFAKHRISVADLVRFPRKKLVRLAEIGYFKYKYGRYPEAQKIFETLVAVDHANSYYHAALGGVYQKILLDAEGKSLWANRARSLVIALKRNLELLKRQSQPPRQQRRPTAH